MTTYYAIWVFFLLYFVCYFGAHLLLNQAAFFYLSRRMASEGDEVFPPSYSEYELPISIILPAYNEEATIASSVRSLLQLTYSEFEVIVVNDGSTDRTLEVMASEFSVLPFPEAYRVQINTKPLRAVYRSRLHPNVRVIDKENGGKADSVNAGINAARYPLFCVVDADSVLVRDSLEQVAEPFLEDPRTIASGGTVRVLNGCEVSGGFLVKTGLPRALLPLFQIVEYMRAFLLGRISWSRMNALPLISGAFGLFRKDTVIEVGGFRTDTVGEDMELIMRLHRHCRLHGKPYRIIHIPEPICWTEAPESLRILRKQRVRWQRGLSESLTMNRGIFLNRRGGLVGWVAFPFYVVFEWMSPIVEVGGYAFTLFAYSAGFLSKESMVLFLAVALGFGIFLSVSALLMEEISFHIYPGLRHVLLLSIIAVLENFGYRQLNAAWKLWGLFQWVFGLETTWEREQRKASWQKD